MTAEIARKKSEMRILVIEDEFMVSMLLEQVLRDWGFENILVAHALDAALTLIAERTPDFAFLDVILGDQASFEAADRLASKGVPFIFLTAVSEVSLPAKWRDQLRLQKPVHFAELSKLCNEFLPN